MCNVKDVIKALSIKTKIFDSEGFFFGLKNLGPSQVLFKILQNLENKIFINPENLTLTIFKL